MISTGEDGLPFDRRSSRESQGNVVTIGPTTAAMISTRSPEATREVEVVTESMLKEVSTKVIEM
jgi:hypothetical protein